MLFYYLLQDAINFFFLSFATDEEKSRLGRSLDAEDSRIPVPKFKTLKVALMCPPSFAAKYNSGKLNVTTGGVESYLLILANIVGSVFVFIFRIT